MFESKFKFEGGVLTNIDGSLPKIGIDRKGYQYVSLSSSRVFVHRVIFYLSNGYLPKFIDHKDGDKMNNTPSNLREATISENNRNVGITKNNTSGYKGVTKEKNREKWRAQIKFNGEVNYLGVFESPVEAAKAYDKKCLELHGEFALTNKKLMRY